MIELTDGMLLYHGSYVAVSEIDLGRCTRGLDFGVGFYLTSSYKQAYSYVPLSVKKAVQIGYIPNNFRSEDGQVSVYRFHYNPNLLIHYFHSASPEWLHFVAVNREPSLFPELLKKYQTTDIVGGKIANDRTAATIQAYIHGFPDAPGLPETDAAVIIKLLPNRLQDQFCFRTEEAIACLEFVRSDRYGDIKL